MNNNDLSRVLIGTSNLGKANEIREFLKELPVEFVTILDVFAERPEEPVEDGETFTDNAVIKARHYARLSGLPCLADDSGLCVDGLDGFPGLRAHRFAITDANPDPSDADRNDLLVKLMNNHGFTQSTATYWSAVVLCSPAGEVLLQAEHAFEGMVKSTASGHNGFAFDPYFYPKEFGYARSCADLTLAEKNAVSHRGKALVDVKEKFAELLLHT